MATGNIYITGFQGSGKTTLAQKYADKTGYKVIHLDDFINKHLTDPEIDWKAIKTEMSDFLTESNNEECLIIEGVQLLILYNLIDFDKHTFILIDNDPKILAERGWQRDSMDPEIWINDIRVYTKEDYIKLFLQEYEESKKTIEELKANSKIKVVI